MKSLYEPLSSKQRCCIIIFHDVGSNLLLAQYNPSILRTLFVYRDPDSLRIFSLFTKYYHVTLSIRSYLAKKKKRDLEARARIKRRKRATELRVNGRSGH